MKNLKRYSVIFLFFLFSSMNTSSQAQQVAELDVHNGAIEILDFANRYILVNDLPLFLDASATVLSKSEKRISRYNLKLGQLVKVEYKYDVKLNKERVSKISILK